MLRLERQPKRNTVLYDGERELGRLTYPKWYSSRAEILLPDGVYELVPKGFWSTGLTASYQGIPVMNVRFRWKGGGKIERPGQPERMLTYKMSSFWKSQYVVTDMQGRERMIHRAKASWKYMDSNHEIEKMGEPPLEPLEILMLVHAINVSNRRAGAAAAT